MEGVFKAYREDDLIEMGSIEDSVNGTNVLVERDEVGIITITNTDTDEEIVKERDFWFAWYAFHPDTQVYLPEGEELPPAEEGDTAATPLGSLLMPLGLLAAFLLVQRSRK